MKTACKILLPLYFLLPAICFGRQSVNSDSLSAGSTGLSCNTSCNCGNGTRTPLGIITDHIHPKGEWMFSYTYMNMGMIGNNVGDAKADDNTVYKNYMMAPEKMNMQMHMVMLMYGISDRISVMAMGGYAIANMSMNMSANMPPMPGMVMSPGNTTMLSTSSGFADTRIYGLFSWINTENRRVIANLGVSLPTGTIRATGTTMLGADQRLPYDMQPGTGSFSLLPGITAIQQFNLLSVGAYAGADLKLANNTLGYRQGNVYEASLWAGYKFLPFVSGSLRAGGIVTDKITGSDPAVAIPIYESFDPTANTANYGGKVVNMSIGLNFHTQNGWLDKFNLLTEYSLPVYQDLNGTQMALHATFLAGLQYKL